jgi:EmrB/QacA subfamily drug resistance transporter
MSAQAPAPAIPGTPAGAPKDFDAALIKIAVVVVIGTFMSILDTTIVNVAINTLAVDFHSSLATIQWVSTGYMLALATVIPLTGYFADRFGTKRLYMVSIGLFLAGSALSGLAWSANSLIAFRVIQGLGGGMIMPAGMTILTHAAGPQRMGRVMGMVGVPMLLGPILGPIIGGALIDSASWRWIFFVNIPIGAVALYLAQRNLATDKPNPHSSLDWPGLAMLSPGLALFVYGLAEIASSGSFTSGRVLFGLIAGGLLVIGFIVRANRMEEGALIDVRLFKRRAVGASAGTTFLFGTAFFGTMFLVPLYYQIVRGQSPLHAGLLLAPQGIGAMITMPIAGRLTDKMGAGKIVLVGLGFIIVGMFGLTQITATTSFWVLGVILFLNGLGMGATMMPAMSAALRTLSYGEVARATSGLNVVQRTGGALGTAILSVVLTRQLVSHLPNNGGHVQSGLSAISSLPAAAQAQVAPVVANAFGHTFYWSLAIIVLALIPASFLSREKPVVETGGAPAAPLVVE